MRQDALLACNRAKLDPTATPDEVRERERLFELAQSDTSEPSDYWQQSRAADQQWYSRLDAIATNKKAQVNEARAGHANARSRPASSRNCGGASMSYRLFDAIRRLIEALFAKKESQ